MNIGPDNHLGYCVFEHMKLHLDSVCQIDAATGEKETYASVLSRSICLAVSLREFGLKPGDILALGGRNHLDIHVPFYAALFNGLTIVGVDPFFKYDEVYTLFKLTKPKIAFCQSESYDVYAKAAADLGIEIKLITFDEGECTLTKFIKTYHNERLEQEFQVAKFDIGKIYAFLISTSGTTGKVKLAAFNHKPFLIKSLGFLKSTSANQKNRRSLMLSPVHWISSYFSTTVSPLLADTMIQTSKPDNFDHVIEMINKYKPQHTLCSPTLMSFLVARKDEVDLTCFQSIGVTGSKVYPDIFKNFKELLAKDAIVMEAYGQTETIGPVLIPNPEGPLGNCGKPIPGYSIKLTDTETGKEITEPHVVGELWSKGLGFTEYYNEPEETALAFSEDGYYKTGDLLYFDENMNFYFVDRIKTLIKYRNSHVLPTELEEVIRMHPAVHEVCVVGIRHKEDGQRPAACVILKPGLTATEMEIQHLVADKLSKNKELRGGVVFLDRLPYTSTGKIARGKVIKILENQNKE